jgi:hypothetical protein
MSAAWTPIFKLARSTDDANIANSSDAKTRFFALGNFIKPYGMYLEEILKAFCHRLAS